MPQTHPRSWGLSLTRMSGASLSGIKGIYLKSVLLLFSLSISSQHQHLHTLFDITAGPVSLFLAGQSPFFRI